MASKLAGANASLLCRTFIRSARPQYLRVRATKPTVRNFTPASQLQVKKYTEDHEWVDYEPGSSEPATMGISEYAAKALGDVVYVELPTVDLDVTKGDSIGAVESVKSASDILTPVSGTVVEVNNVLEDKAGTINKSPEGEGWFAKITVSDASELDDLMDEAAYAKFTEEAESK